MPLAFDNPATLLLLLILPLIVVLGRSRLAFMMPWRRRAILGLRLASMAAVTVALAGPSALVNDSSMSVAFVVDTSPSMAHSTVAGQEQWVREAVGQMRSTDRAAVVAFAGEPRVVRQLGDERTFSLTDNLPARAGSDLSAALKLASGVLPASGLRKIVVLTDGWDTSGRVEESVRSLAGGTRVEVVPFPAMEGKPEVLVESVSVPPYAREGDSFDVSAVIGANYESPTRVSLLVDGKITGGWNIQLTRGANLITVPQKPLTLGFHSIRMLLTESADTVAQNNFGDGFIVVKPKGSVLMVDGRPDVGRELRQQLEGTGMKVDDLLYSEFPSQMTDLLRYDAIVLNDVSGRNLSLDQMKMLDAFVKDQGRGLFVSGGTESYGLGDYSNRLLEDMLPVSSESPLSRERGDMLLMLVIDKSGSMDESYQGVSKIGMAREAAIQAIGALKENDKLGVLAFDTEQQWLVNVQEVSGNLPDFRSRISRLQASGGTDIYSALQQAYNAIRGARATQKHIILLSDGQSWKGPYQALIQRLNQDKITLSTIAVGTDADTNWLTELARLGEGRYYFTQQYTDLPRIVIREVSAATKVAKVEGQIQPRFTAPSPALRGVNKDAIPPLTGYVATKPKDAATIVLKSDRGDPLLAQWQYGLGRVVSWTSDAAGLWSSVWVASPEFRQVWDQAIRWSMAPPVDRTLQVNTSLRGNLASVIVDSVNHDGRYVNLADTRARVWDPDGNQVTVPLRQTAAGRYEGSIAAPKPGVYRVDVQQVREAQPTVQETSGFAVPGTTEFRRLESNDALLREVGTMTGGRITRNPTDAFSREGLPSSPGWQPLWAYLVALAILLLPVEVALRRIRSLPFARDADVERGLAPPVDLSEARRAAEGEQQKAA